MSNYILVVDDNPSDLILTSAYLEAEELVPIQAVDGFDALDKLDEFPYRLIVVDLQMPKMGGIELIRRIQLLEDFKNVPIMVTSARNESKDVKRAIQVGANDYLVKPIDRTIFQEKLGRLLGKSQRWTNYDIDPESELATGYILRPMTLMSLNEIGVRVKTENLLKIDDSIEIGGLIFKGTYSLHARVKTCEKKGDAYEAQLIFSGLTEATRKSIRLTCRELYLESKTEKEDSEINQ